MSDFYYPACEHPEEPCDADEGEMCDACRECDYWLNLPIGGLP